MELHPEDPIQWASLPLAQAKLGDAREGLQGFILHSVLAVRWWGKRDRGRRKRP